MDEREVYEKIKEQVCRQARMMRAINRQVPVTGERFDLPAKGRGIGIVYFRAKRKDAPLVLGFHGGGFLFGGNAMNDAMWASVRDRLDVNVASVEYRKSPDYRYQEALDDAYDAAVYLKEHAKEFGFDAQQISVMGCSAGAGLAATVCIYAKKRGGVTFRNQILMYPFLDAYTDPNAKGGGGMEGPLMYIFNELHCTPDEAKLSVVSPVFADPEELTGLPAAVFCMADHDNLKGEGYRYADMLRKAGVPVCAMECEGMPHAFFESGFGEIDEQELSMFGDDMAALVRSGRVARASREALDFVAQHFWRENE